MENLLQDLRYALRLLRRSPGFAAAAILTLALGMGANTVMFSVLNTVLLRPLPYPQPDRLVQVWETDSRLNFNRGPVSPYHFLEWRKASQTFVHIATYDFNSMVLAGQKTPRRLGALFVTADFFDVLGVSPLKGRTFLPGEDIYGVIAFSVAQRTHEIGVRMALGADKADVLRLILRQSARIAVLGLATGTGAALLATRALSSLLFGVKADDPAIFFGVAASLLVVVLAASYVPARKATQVDPLIALRYE
jgi:putative ABC transport system permease protein